MRIYGLIGRNIDYSFSRNYFSTKFKAEGIPAIYKNFDLDSIVGFRNIIRNTKDLGGLNVTIPYKEKIIPYLDNLDPVAAEIGAVNTIKLGGDGILTGFNTDQFGFIQALKPHLRPHHLKALILGTGGASKAVAYSLNKLRIEYKFVSRTPGEDNFIYQDLDEETIREYKIVINCTPLGTFPNISASPNIPSHYFTSQHLVFDLIYNPAYTTLMKGAIEQGATALNGYQMLEYQAEKAWKIWNRQ